MKRPLPLVPTLLSFALLAPLAGCSLFGAKPAWEEPPPKPAIGPIVEAADLHLQLAAGWRRNHYRTQVDPLTQHLRGVDRLVEFTRPIDRGDRIVAGAVAVLFARFGSSGIGHRSISLGLAALAQLEHPELPCQFWSFMY